MDASTTQSESRYREHVLPLCVDLDGTLLRSDVLLESIVALLRCRPLYALRVLVRLIRGRAKFKEAAAENVDLNVTHLPYRKELVNYIREEPATGRHTILATASNEKSANEIAAQLDCFDEVIASNSARNLKGRFKARTLVEQFAEHLRSMGVTNGYLAVLVVALYINSDSVSGLYSEARLLWLLCPVMLYWISRVWLKTGRGAMLNDSLVFTVKDRASWILAVNAVFILFGAL